MKKIKNNIIHKRSFLERKVESFAWNKIEELILV